MKMKNVGLMVIILLNLACEEKPDKYLKRLSRESLYNNDYWGWTINQKISKGEYSIYKYDGDTLKSLKFVFDENEIPLIGTYEIQFPCNSADTCTVRIDTGDTLFYYSQNRDQKRFIVGEYTYRYMKTGLGDEYEYYYLYKDSLRKVKGDNLPKLPQLTPSEREKFNVKIAKERSQ